jgi:hypothetical protein
MKGRIVACVPHDIMSSIDTSEFDNVVWIGITRLEVCGP